uniref:Phosphoglycerate mutase n=1 Tax=Cyclophora tenuis TaxID=216820 RepID=A0A7S1DB77_CYCTE
MAQKLREANFVHDKGIQVIAHSPLKRARETCRGLFGRVAPTESTTEERDGVLRVVQLDSLLEKTPTEWIPGNLGPLTNRITKFEQWIADQPEDVIAVVGHSQFFKAMLEMNFKFGNVDVWQVHYHTSGKSTKEQQTNGEEEEEEEEEYKVPRGWSSLKRLYACKGEGE